MSKWKPGEGYLIKMKAESTLQYTPTGKRNFSMIERESALHFGNVKGNPADPTWTIYLSSAQLDGNDLEAGDEIAVFNDGIMVGALILNNVLTEMNQFDNFVTAWKTLDNGPGYVPGNQFSIRCWDMSESKEYESNQILWNNTYSDEYIGDVFPETDSPYSIASIHFTRIPKGSLDGDEFVDLDDAIIALKISAGIHGDNVSLKGDVNGDQRIGIIEAIYILRILMK